MRYYLIRLLTRCGEFEFIYPCVLEVEEGQSVVAEANAIRDNWYPDDLDFVDPDEVAWFGNGNAVTVDRIEEIPEEHYKVLQQYI